MITRIAKSKTTVLILTNRESKILNQIIQGAPLIKQIFHLDTLKASFIGVFSTNEKRAAKLIDSLLRELVKRPITEDNTYFNDPKTEECRCLPFNVNSKLEGQVEMKINNVPIPNIC